MREGEGEREGGGVCLHDNGRGGIERVLAVRGKGRAG